LEKKRKEDMQSTTGITLGDETRKLLKKHVPYGDLEKRAVPHNQQINFSHAGEADDGPLPKGSEGVMTTSWSTLYSRLGADLDVETCGHGANISLQYDCEVVSMQEEKEKILLEYRRQGNEEKKVVDLVIGADGGRSFVRDTVLLDSKSEYSGHIAWRGEVSKQQWPSQFERVQQGGLGLVQMPKNNSYILL
jgi:2-polyprenyl-6-methoxyphenol hydroxylase-like FAD-dependent oxidoreductase